MKKRGFGCLSNASPFSRIFLLYDLREAGFSSSGWFLLLLRQPGTLSGVPGRGLSELAARALAHGNWDLLSCFAELRMASLAQ